MVKLSVISSELNRDRFEELKYTIKKDGDLFIAKTNENVNIHRLGNLDLKGVIFDEHYNLVAPGCNVPLEELDETRTDIKGYASAIDGVQYRIYFHENEWRYSTNGRITPDVFWGAKGTPTFTELFSGAADQWDSSALNQNYCYYVFLEHPQFTNVVKHQSIKLTLVDIIDMGTPELNHIELDMDTGFTNHLVITQEVPTLTSDTDPRPLTSGDIGYCIYYYSNNSIYRQESSLYEHAVSVKPNMSDPAQHWVYLTQNETIDTYLMFYPWNEDFFNSMEEKYNILLRTIAENYDSIRDIGWRDTEIPSRHVKYMKDLVRDLNHIFNTNPSHGYDIIEDHLLDQDTKRLYFLINPYEVPPRIREQKQETTQEPTAAQEVTTEVGLDDIMMAD